MAGPRLLAGFIEAPDTCLRIESYRALLISREMDNRVTGREQIVITDTPVTQLKMRLDRTLTLRRRRSTLSSSRPRFLQVLLSVKTATYNESFKPPKLRYESLDHLQDQLMQERGLVKPVCIRDADRSIVGRDAGDDEHQEEGDDDLDQQRLAAGSGWYRPEEGARGHVQDSGKGGAREYRSHELSCYVQWNL